jgi:hypothetical protein
MAGLMDTVVYRPISGECGLFSSGGVEKQTVAEVIEGYEPENMYSSHEAGLFFMLPPNKTLSVKGNPCSGGKNSKDRMTVLLACNISATDGLPPLAVGKSEKSHFRNVRNLHAKYGTNTKVWVLHTPFLQTVQGHEMSK